MQVLVLVISRFQVSVVNRQYEKSRWALVTAALLLVIHYGLQMVYGFRAHSDDAGVIVNILFYTPVAFLVAHSILNLECENAVAVVTTCCLACCLWLHSLHLVAGGLHATVCTCPMSKWCCTPSIWYP